MGIDTSCDDTGVGLVRDGKVVVNLVASQVRLHEAFGGVVPELASREHLKALPLLVERALAEAGFGVVTGGGPGVMEAVNRGAYEAGGVSVGLNIELPHEQKPNPYQTHALSLRYFFVRKVLFVRYAVGFVFLPGGFGTLDELSEVLVLLQTEKVHRFPVFLLDRGYWEGLVRWLAFLRDQKAVGPEDLQLFRLTDEPEEVVQALKAEAPPR